MTNQENVSMPQEQQLPPPSLEAMPIIGIPLPQIETVVEQGSGVSMDINAANAHMTPIRLAQMKANVAATGHPSEFAGMGAALIKRSEEAEALKARVLANRPPIKHNVTDKEGNLISPPPELISKTPWSPNEK